MNQVPCLASKWADEYSDEFDRDMALTEAIEDELNGDTSAALSCAQDLADKEGLDTDEWTDAQWDGFVSERWEDIVQLYKEKQA